MICRYHGFHIIIREGDVTPCHIGDSKCMVSINKTVPLSKEARWICIGEVFKVEQGSIFFHLNGDDGAMTGISETSLCNWFPYNRKRPSSL